MLALALLACDLLPHLLQLSAQCRLIREASNQLSMK